MEFSNSNIKTFFYIFLKKSFSYISEKGNPGKILIFQETELSYILGGTSKAPKTKVFNISPKRVINKFF